VGRRLAPGRERVELYDFLEPEMALLPSGERGLAYELRRCSILGGKHVVLKAPLAGGDAALDERYDLFEFEAGARQPRRAPNLFEDQPPNLGAYPWSRGSEPDALVVQRGRQRGKPHPRHPELVEGLVLR
jgi:hypothetical protein